MTSVHIHTKPEVIGDKGCYSNLNVSDKGLRFDTWHEENVNTEIKNQYYYK